MTPRQRQALRFIAEFIRRNGYSPSYPEIAKGLGLVSLASVSDHVRQLNKRCLITYRPFIARSILLTTLGTEQVQVSPVVGEGAAACPPPLNPAAPQGYESSEEVDPEGIQPWP